MKMDRQCAIERLGRECAMEAIRVGGGDPTYSLLPTRPLLGDYEALEDLVGGELTCRQVEEFDEAYKEALEDAQQVKSFLRSAGYSEQSVREGFEYADSIGHSDVDDLGQLALSRILYSDRQLADGKVVGWDEIERRYGGIR
jgi:hypothetical protein